MKNRVLFVDAHKKNEIDNLRMQEYANAKGFDVDLTTLKWKQSDDESFVMAAETAGLLIATMRGEVINNISILEQKLECPWSFSLPLEMPVLLLSRAATLSSHRNTGLNLILRYWFLRFALHHNIDFVIGTFVSGSARENSLRAMGYQFFENELGWQQSTYRSQSPVTVVALNLKTHAEQAIKYCLDRADDGIKKYYFDQPFPILRTVSTL